MINSNKTALVLGKDTHACAPASAVMGRDCGQWDISGNQSYSRPSGCTSDHAIRARWVGAGKTDRGVHDSWRPRDGGDGASDRGVEGGEDVVVDLVDGHVPDTPGSQATVVCGRMGMREDSDGLSDDREECYDEDYVPHVSASKLNTIRCGDTSGHGTHVLQWGEGAYLNRKLPSPNVLRFGKLLFMQDTQLCLLQARKTYFQLRKSVVLASGVASMFSSPALYTTQFHPRQINPSRRIHCSVSVLLKIFTRTSR